MTGPATASGRDCAVHVHRSLVPIEVHHVWPLGMGGPNRAGNRVRVCSNGHSSAHDYLDLLVAGQGSVPWRMAVRYGWRVRRLAKRGYEAWLAEGDG